MPGRLSQRIASTVYLPSAHRIAAAFHTSADCPVVDVDLPCACAFGFLLRALLLGGRIAACMHATDHGARNGAFAAVTAEHFSQDRPAGGAYDAFASTHRWAASGLLRSC